MKLSKFLKLQNNCNILEKNLIHLSGGSDISINDLWNRIYFKVEEFMASGCEEYEIKEMIERILGDYELRTPELKNKTKVFMKKLGFKFDEEDEK